MVGCCMTAGCLYMSSVYFQMLRCMWIVRKGPKMINKQFSKGQTTQYKYFTFPQESTPRTQVLFEPRTPGLGQSWFPASTAALTPGLAFPEKHTLFLPPRISRDYKLKIMMLYWPSVMPSFPCAGKSTSNCQHKIASLASLDQIWKLSVAIHFV